MSPSSGMFVGRVRELAHLRSALNDCLGGRGKMFVATGEAGIGKTSLARKVADMAAQQGFEVVWGRCWEGAEAPAFWPWIQIFRSLCAQGPSSAAATEIAGLVPVLQDPGEPDRPEHALFRLFDGAASHLQNRSAERPLVLILEDLHEADRTSLKLLNFLARQIDASRLLVFGTCRKPEMDLSPLGEDLATLMRLGQRIPLSGLRESEVAELLAHGFGMVLSAEELSSLRHRTEGNPFFVDEIARDLVSQEQPAQFTTATIQVPEGLKAPIRRRLAALRDEDRSLLALAAVIGREFEFEVVTTAGELARESALQRLSALATRRLVAPAGFGIGPYRFSHALVRETVYEDLEDLERRELHARVGRAIEHLHGSELDRYVDQLAHHFLQAAVLGETQRAMNYSRRAGLLASRRLGYDEAIEHYRRALALAGTAQPSMSIDLLLSLGDAQWWAGRPAEAEESFQEAARQARAAKDVHRLAEAALRVGEAGYGGAYTQAWNFDHSKVALLEEAVSALGAEQSALRVRVASRLATALYFAPFDTAARRQALSRDAVRLARHMGDRSTLAYALNARHLAVWDPDNLEERLTLSEEIVDLARESGEFGLELTGLAWRITNHYELGDAGRAHREIDAYCALADRLGYPHFQATAFMFRATKAIFYGDLALAEELAGRSKELGERIADVNVSLSHCIQMAVISELQGRPEQGAAYMERVSLDHPPELRQLVKLTGLCRMGLPSGASESFHLVWDVRELIPGAFWLSNYAAGLSLIAADAGASREMAEMYDRILPYEPRWILPGRDAVAPVGTVAEFLGVLAARLERFDEAAAHFRTATEAAERAGSPPYLARARAGWGALLLRRGRTSDLNEATKLLSDAAKAADELGMPGLLTKVEAARSQMDAGTSVMAGSPVASTPSVMRCEGDYWTIVFDNAVSRVKDSRGMRYLWRLLAEPGREFHALDLAAEGRPSVGQPLLDQILLDPAAKAAYRTRLSELENERQEAENDNDLERASMARAEIDALVGELVRAAGLGGRDRSAPTPAERARSAVSKSIRSSLKRIDQSNPQLGAHLAATIRTGYFCSYQPDPRIAVDWTG